MDRYLENFSTNKNGKYKFAPWQTNKDILLIFDCDGVLVDSENLAAKAEAAALRVAGCNISEAEIANRFAGMTSDQMIDNLSKNQCIIIDSIKYSQCFEEIRFNLFENHLKRIPDVHNALETIPFKKCVASNSDPKRLHHSLSITNLKAYFGSNIFSAAEVGKPKPAPDLFNHISIKLHVSPTSCIVIEDSLSGVKAARAAKMRTIGFVGGSHCKQGCEEQLQEAGAELIVHKMADLPSALAALTTK